MEVKGGEHIIIKIITIDQPKLLVTIDQLI